jgi:hypothetical protein
MAWLAQGKKQLPAELKNAMRTARGNERAGYNELETWVKGGSRPSVLVEAVDEEHAIAKIRYRGADLGGAQGTLTMKVRLEFASNHIIVIDPPQFVQNK